MIFKSRLVSFILACSIATVTTAFISLVKDVNNLAVFVAFIISFSSSFLLIYFTIEFLVLGEVNEAYAVLEKIKKKDFKIAKKRVAPTLSPIKKLNYEIYTYASKKQKEIDHLKKLAIYRREFLADVSHELKTPIFAAQGFIHTLRDGAIDDLSVRDKFLHKAARSLDSLQILVEDLITLSKMEAGIVTMQYESFNLYETIREVFEELEKKANRKQFKLLFDDQIEQMAWVWADPGRIKRVIINLMENSIKYGKKGGHVHVSIKALDKQFEVKVIDDGPGISPEHLERIFERFYRVEKSRSKSRGGSGLGLSIVKHILEAHQSSIQVQSTLGKGSTFKFKIKKSQELKSVPSQGSNANNTSFVA